MRSLFGPPSEGGRIETVCLDFETTDLDISTARIVEVGVVSLSWRQGNTPAPTPTFTTLLDTIVDPGVVIPQSASRVHGIGDARATMAPPTRDVLVTLLSILDDFDAVVGFNIDDYDWRVLAAECRRWGLAVEFAALNSRLVVIDVMRLLPRRRSLVAVAGSLFGDEGHFDAHSAVADATMTGRVLTRLIADGVVRL
jgi:DNA polymerase III epsilon subunit-like protein